MKIYDMEQGSDEWLQIRAGKITGSNFKKVMAKGSGSTRQAFLDKVCWERRNKRPFPETFKSKAMDWGNEYEDEAIKEYCKRYGYEIGKIGFVELSDWIGSSPDALVSKDGMVEAKCPEPQTHWKYLKTNLLKPEWYDPAYKYQMQGNLWCLERDWCDWISYDPRCTNIQDRLIRVRVYRDDKLIKSLEEECNIFIEEAQSVLSMFDVVNF